MKSLIPIDYERIIWENEGKLYRGHRQGEFEYDLAKGFGRDEPPSYCGASNVSQGRYTFCSSEPINMISSIMQRNFNDEREFITGSQDFFTLFPIGMEIDARSYRERLFRSIEGEGIVITGPISIDDINIVYSSRKDLLGDLFSEEWTSRLKEKLDSKIERASWISRDDLLSKYEKDPEEVRAFLMTYLYGMRMSLSPSTAQEMDKVDEYLQILREKLE
jgi:hypothetical protein